MDHGLRVALINPPHVARLNREFETGVPPLGLGWIAAHLRAHSVDCDVFDLADEWPIDPNALDRAGLFSYGVYGLTSYTKNFFAARELLSMIRIRLPAAIIVLGGPHAGAMPERILDTVPEADFVVRNEGEGAMLGLVREIGSSSPQFEHVPNLVYRLGTEIRASRHAEETELSLDSYAWPVREARVRPAQPKAFVRRDGKVVRTEFFSSSRGCPKRCTFCSIIVMSPQYRYRSVASLMEEIRHIHHARPFGHIIFLDANFFVHWRRALEFAERLHEFDSSITWSGTATTDQVCRHWDAVIRMGRLNCASLEIGIENGSNSVLTRFNKRTTVEQNLACIEILQAAGITLELDYILFDPCMSLDELAENVSFIRKAGLADYAPAHHLYSAVKLYPGTAIRTQYTRRHSLPDDEFGIPPFEDPAVQAAYDCQIWFARRYLDQIERAIATLDPVLDGALADDGAVSGVDPLLASELLVNLRSIPFTFFAAIFSKQGAGRRIELSTQELEDLAANLNLPGLLELARQIGTPQRPSDRAPRPPLEWARAALFKTFGGSYLISDMARPLALSEEGQELVQGSLRPRGLSGKATTLRRLDLQHLLGKLGIAATSGQGP